MKEKNVVNKYLALGTLDDYAAAAFLSRFREKNETREVDWLNRIDRTRKEREMRS